MDTEVSYPVMNCLPFQRSASGLKTFAQADHGDDFNLELLHFLFVPQESILGAISGHISLLSTPSLTVNASELVSAGVGTVDEEGNISVAHVERPASH